MRLVRASPGARRPPLPPFGLPSWSEGAQARALLVEVPKSWPSDGVGDVAVVAGQLPEAADLPPGTLVVVLGSGDGEGLASRWLGARARIARAVRGSALLARGYVNIGAGVDPATRQDLVWGYAQA